MRPTSRRSGGGCCRSCSSFRDPPFNRLRQVISSIRQVGVRGAAHDPDCEAEVLHDSNIQDIARVPATRRGARSHPRPGVHDTEGESGSVQAGRGAFAFY